PRAACALRAAERICAQRTFLLPGLVRALKWQYAEEISMCPAPKVRSRPCKLTEIREENHHEPAFHLRVAQYAVGAKTGVLGGRRVSLEGRRMTGGRGKKGATV